MALIYTPRIFANHSEVRAGLTLRGGSHSEYSNNMSLSVGDDDLSVIERRTALARHLGFEPERLATQRQVHGSAVVVVDDGYLPVDSDAMLTDRAGWLLAVSVADCVPLLLFDPVHRVVGGVHSGWRGTQLNVVGAAVAQMSSVYETNPEDLLCYVGVAASGCCYEVRDDVAERFDERFSTSIGDGKYLFDNKGQVLEQLISCGLQPINIEVDVRCTICDASFHSHRRDRERSGRMFAVIGMATKSADADALGTA